MKIKIETCWTRWLFGFNWLNEDILGMRFRYLVFHFGPCYIMFKSEKELHPGNK